jgi:uncharacterized protein
MKEENALLIFTKNLVYGNVKTRLAATIGKDKAFETYKKLLAHTVAVTQSLCCTKFVYYADAVEQNDAWNDTCKKRKQQGNDLGERMMHAFLEVFNQGSSTAVIIGTDCPELGETIIQSAFEQLTGNDVVIGPAADGGYYLLGMKSLHPQLFEKIAWSTSAVLETTMNRCRLLRLSYALLPLLHDVDEEEDLRFLSTIDR